MGIDTDLGRDEASSFGPASLLDGAILPYDGRSLLQRSDGPPPAAIDAETDGWLSPSNPVLVRGRARILPLAWRGDPGGGHGAGVQPVEIEAFASHMQSTGMHWAGNWRVLDLADRRDDGIGSYTAALRAAGATRVDCWTCSDAVGIALVWAGDEDEGTASLALHIVPAGWVSEPRVGEAVRGVDVRWSWADVIALYAETLRRLDDVDLSAAIVLFLANQPGGDAEFRASFDSGAACGAARFALRSILLETMRIQPDWDQPLSGIGEEVERVMHERHPELSDAALRSLRKHFTHLVT